MDGLDMGSPPRLHCLGRIRTESSDDSREHLWPFRRRAKIRPWRPGFAFGSAALPALRTNAVRGLFGSKRSCDSLWVQRKASGLRTRQLHLLWWPAHRGTISEQVLRAIEGNAIDAALKAATEI